LNCALIFSTIKSAFMRAMISLTFCLSLGFSASFLGIPCASAHLTSFCCLLSCDPPAAFLCAAIVFTAAFLAFVLASFEIAATA
jgi:hypothetical protein